jgi:DNA-binding CsgD family transcriptional regulator/tetratricopeptide (TPR) repeat protein
LTPSPRRGTLGTAEIVHAPLASTSEAPTELLERAAQLEALSRAFQAVRERRRGRLVLIEGEAGVGKTALARRFCDERGGTARILWGACDGLFTPRPLGPLVDVAEITGSDLEEVVGSGALPHEVAAALMRELSMLTSVLVLEDLHWADEATLDVFRLLARRVDTVRALVIASYRGGELAGEHPLRVVLGELATTRGIERIGIAPLSPVAVARLAEPYGVDAEELFRRTAGNPFFVTEVLAAGEEDIPHTVRDAVLARAARLSRPARKLLETVAVLPPHAELWLLEELAGASADRLDECVASGMLTAEPGAVAFRHELARLAIEDSLAANRRVTLHRAALEALGDRAGRPPDLDRLAHHAEAARDAEAVLRFAPAAAERAASLGAHREAAAQYVRAVRFAGESPLERRAELLERRAHECYLADQVDDAIASLREAIECRKRLGDRLGEGQLLRSLANLLWCPGRRAEAELAAGEAVALLEQLPPGRELAMAYSELSRLCMNADDAEGALAWGGRAIELADRLGDDRVLVHALTNVGTTELKRGLPEGRQKLERSLELARKVEDEEGVARALVNLVETALLVHSYPLVDRNVEEGLAFAVERGLEIYRLYLIAFRAVAELGQGRWTEAEKSAGLVLHEPCVSTLPRTHAQVVIGLLRARRSGADVWPPLDEALALAEPTGELVRIAPVAAARAEAAWLEGRHDAVAEATEAALELALARQSPWMVGELACWRRRAGVLDDTPEGAAEPYALELAGDWKGAAASWTRLGCPYEAALALASADDDVALRRSLDELHGLGARPAAAIVARRLRERGARGLPRGPRPATRENPANLTRREVEVLRLVADGLRSAEIAERLFLSRKTVDNHVSAILRKLDARSRAEASAEAVRLGMTAPR